jgi:hypothetical protein
MSPLGQALVVGIIACTKIVLLTIYKNVCIQPIGSSIASVLVDQFATGLTGGIGFFPYAI